MRTHSTKASDIERKWWIIDASGKKLGRLATEAAVLLKGKHKPVYTPHLDVGDFVVVVNAAKIEVTGKKLSDKIYYRHSNYPGGFKSVNLEELLQTNPTRAIEYAVKGMLPHNRLGAAMFKKLKVYAGPEHPHEAQVKATEKEN
ncbi:MAG: 50S ribosomal protein L13 [Chloroflexi bacterium]|nr:50S ribosomal protein L13 [Chloroflexota bacterium]